jgi:hypothetical protein
MTLVGLWPKAPHDMAVNKKVCEYNMLQLGEKSFYESHQEKPHDEYES